MPSFVQIAETRGFGTSLQVVLAQPVTAGNVLVAYTASAGQINTQLVSMFDPTIYTSLILKQFPSDSTPTSVSLGVATIPVSGGLTVTAQFAASATHFLIIAEYSGVAVNNGRIVVDQLDSTHIPINSFNQQGTTGTETLTLRPSSLMVCIVFMRQAFPQPSTPITTGNLRVFDFPLTSPWGVALFDSTSSTATFTYPASMGVVALGLAAAPVPPAPTITQGPPPVGSWLVSKKLQYVEEASYGVLPSSPSYTPIAYESQVLISAPTRLAPLYQPNSEDPQVLVEQGMDLYTIDMSYRPYDTVFAQYGFNAQGGGSGTIDASLGLAMSVLLQGTTEYFFQPAGCRVESVRIGGRAGGPITVRSRVASQLIETPSTIVPTGLFAANPQNIPLQFNDGGSQPVRIDGLPYNVNSIQVEAKRNLDRIPQPNSQVAQTIIPRERQITGSISILWLSTDNYARLRQDKPFTLNWALKPPSALTLYGTRFKALSNLRIVQGETIRETYTLEASQGVLT